jgi:hypothetical protein
MQNFDNDEGGGPGRIICEIFLACDQVGEREMVNCWMLIKTLLLYPE